MPTVSSPRLPGFGERGEYIGGAAACGDTLQQHPALAWAMSWRAKIASVPIVGYGRYVGRLGGWGGRRIVPAGRRVRSLETRSFASVAEPPLPKVMSLPPRSSRSATARAIWEMALVSDSAAADRRLFTSCIFWSIEPCTANNLFERLLSFAEEGVKEGRTSHVVALFAVLEVDVDRLPEQVVEDLEDLLNDKRVSIRRGEGKLPLPRRLNMSGPPLSR